MRILISNDDGVHAPGILALQKYLSRIADAVVVAPLEEKSTTGHSLTLHKPLRLLPFGEKRYAVTGSPADCVYLGIREVMKGTPDLVVSGINRGANLGQDVYYSGTVSAAREACILGIPSLAVSLDVDFFRSAPDVPAHYDSAARTALQVIKKLSKQGKRFGMPKHTLLNLNVPDLPFKELKGIRLARQGFRFYTGNVLRRKDHRGRDYFWVGGSYEGYHEDEGTDCDWVGRGYSSLTPLKLDSTDSSWLQCFEKDWSPKEGKSSSKSSQRGARGSRR